ncbi:uridine kinase [Devosia sp.]|uniref:uridine kinase n=1 Tax=Devosia sp. TaxID=1871048 RepID=UPI0035B44C6F
MRPRIVALSSPPGGGKSTFAAALANRLGAALVEYDAYDRMTDMEPSAVREWLAAGGPYDRVIVPELVADLAALSEGRPIPDRMKGGQLQPRPLVVFETPFGRAHAATAAFIDTSVFIDTPADEALARKLRQFVADQVADPGPGGARRFVGWLDSYLSHYLAIVRPAVAMQRQRVLPLADLVIAPGTALEDGVEQIVAFLVRRAAGSRAAP